MTPDLSLQKYTSVNTPFVAIVNDQFSIVNLWKGYNADEIKIDYGNNHCAEYVDFCPHTATYKRSSGDGTVIATILLLQELTPEQAREHWTYGLEPADVMESLPEIPTRAQLIASLGAGGPDSLEKQLLSGFYNNKYVGTDYLWMLDMVISPASVMDAFMKAPERGVRGAQLAIIKSSSFFEWIK